MPITSNEVTPLFGQLDWQAVVTQLFQHATSRLRWYGQFADRLLPASDYVQEAVARLLEGRRQFNGNTEDDVVLFLCGVVNSLVGHDFEMGLRRRSSVSISIEGDGEGEIQLEYLGWYEIESEIEARNVAAYFISSLPFDLQAYVRSRISNECASANEYADALKVPITAIRNLDRRLHRRRDQFHSERAC